MRNRRGGGRVFPLHDRYGRFLYLITAAQGRTMAKSGLALTVIDRRYGRSCVLRYQETEPITPSNSAATAAAITPKEVMANAGMFGKSKTARLPEWDTKARDSKQARILCRDARRPPEDFVERAQQKVAMWNRVPLTNPRHKAWAS